jgi:hypothetical protein
MARERAKRVFTDHRVPTKAKDNHGGGRYVRTLPDVANKGVGSLNVELSFEEAMRLSVALQSCIMSLNRYKRSTVPGREMGVLLSIKTGNRSISVIEKRIPPE